MGKLKLTDFKGQNRKVARVNLNPNQFYLARDVRVNKEIGKIMIRPGLDEKYPGVGTPPTDLVHKIINWIEADGDERVLLIEEGSTNGWRVQEGTDAGLIATMLSDTGLTRGAHEPNVIIHNDIVRVYLGNVGGTEPIFTNLWYGKITKDFFNNVAAGTASNFDDYYLSSAHLLNYAYNINIAIASLPTAYFNNNNQLNSVPTGTTGDIFNPIYRITYTLDGYQETTFIRSANTAAAPNDDTTEGDIIFATAEWEAADKFDSVAISINILQSMYSNTDRTNDDDDQFNKRISAINLYRTKDTKLHAEATWNGGQNRPEPKSIADGDDIDAAWYLIDSINIDSTSWLDDLVDEWAHGITDTITDTLLIGQQLYDDRMGHSSVCDFSDISYTAYHKQRIWAIKAFDRTAFGTTGDDTRDRLYYSSAQVVSTGTNQALDSIGSLNFISIGQTGDTPTGIVEWGDRLLVFKEDNRYKVFAAATVANSFIEETTNKGCYAPRTLKKTSFGIFFLARDTVYLFDGVRDIEIGTAIEPQLQADYTAAQLKAAFAVYDNEQQQYLLFITDGSNYTCFVLSMRMNPPEWTEYRFYKGVSDVTLTDANYLPDNKIYIAVNTNSVYSIDQLNEDNLDDNGTAIIPIIQSKIFTGSGQDKDLLFTKIGIRHKGREFTLELYKAGGTSLGTITFSNNTNLSSVLKNIAETFQANEVYFTITKSADADGVTNFEIDDIEFDVEEAERMLS